MLLKSFSKLLVGLSFLASASAFAVPTTTTVNLIDVPSYGTFGDPENFIGVVDVGANSTITSIAFDLTLTAFSPSYLSELVVFFGRSDFLNGVFFTPGLGDDGPGTASYSGSASLTDLGLDFQVGADGLLLVEFFEDWDDFAGADGVWNGSFTFGYDTVDAPVDVPEPASALLIAAGLATMRYVGRRRAAKQNLESAIA